MLKIIRLLSVAVRFFFIVFINSLIDLDSAVTLLLLIGWVSVFTIGFGLERQFRISKIRHTSLLDKNIYVFRRVAIVAIPSLAITFTLALIILSIDILHLSHSVIFFALLYFFLDLVFAELSKIYLISGSRSKLCFSVTLRNLSLPIIVITYALVQGMFDFNVFEYGTVVLGVVDFLLFGLLSKCIAFRFFYVFIGYIKSVQSSISTILCGLPPKLNMSTFRSYLGYAYIDTVSLQSIKLLVMVSAVEVFLDIFYWPKNYRVLMSCSVNSGIALRHLFTYSLISALLLVSLTSILYVCHYLPYEALFKYVDISNLYIVDGLCIILIGFLFSLETVISYISVKMNKYEKTQLINSVFSVATFFCIALNFYPALQYVLALLAVIYFWRIKIALR